jgi:hypothetical protein
MLEVEQVKNEYEVFLALMELNSDIGFYVDLKDKARLRHCNFLQMLFNGNFFYYEVCSRCEYSGEDEDDKYMCIGSWLDRLK